MRFQEEGLFLDFEQGRAVVSFEKEALVWDRREGLAAQRDPDPLAQGAAAYAARQANLKRSLSGRCTQLWTAAGIDIIKSTENERQGLVPPSLPEVPSDDDDDEDLRIVGYLEEEDDEL